MSSKRCRLLRWYPRSWRDRYEDEMLALLDDELGDDRAPMRLRLSLLRHGLTERARSWQPLTTTPENRWRTGSLTVLVAWAGFMVGGAGFSKASEHFDRAVPIGSRLLPQSAFTVVAIGGTLGGLIVLAGAALALPAAVAYVRTGGWPTVRPHLVRAVTVSAGTVALTIPLVVWAHRLSEPQRNGADIGYNIAFLAWVALCIASLACWTAVAVAVGRRVDLPRLTLRFEAALATALTATMSIVVAASVVWWVAIASAAPWFLDGTAVNATGSSYSIPLTVAVLTMLGATVLGIGGTIQIHHRRDPDAHS
jgi:hypothetical protein